MPRTRSRPKTEEKFQNAVLELVARDGCGELGINAVAQQAGADKVLIYRYFGDMEGLLQVVAASRQWLPSCEEVLRELPVDSAGSEGVGALTVLRGIQDVLLQHIRSDHCTHQLVRWRRASMCPLCKQFSQEWQSFWKSLAASLGEGLRAEPRSLWQRACALCALIIEAELCDEAVDRQCLQHIAAGLEAIYIEGIDGEETSRRAYPLEESLPTNLL